MFDSNQKKIVTWWPGQVLISHGFPEASSSLEAPVR